MNITVATLIYKSPAYLDFVMKSLIKHHSKKHDVQYLIVCNDATEEVVDRAHYWTEHPKDDLIQVRMVDHRNQNLNDWWIQNVYNAWNRCLIECQTEAICFVNSDMAFTDGWLDRLAEHDLDKYIPTSRLVESERMPSMSCLIPKNFGQTLGTFNRVGFEKFANEVSLNKVISGGPFMPSLFRTSTLRSIGGWRKNVNNTPGDKITFEALRRQLGLKHIMVCNSIAYHFQRGESAECGDY